MNRSNKYWHHNRALQDQNAIGKMDSLYLPKEEGTLWIRYTC